MSGVKLLSRSKPKEHQPSNQSTSSAGYSGVQKASKPSGSRLGAFYSAGPVLSLGGPVQAKMKVGNPGDQYEREADSVAERIMGGGRGFSISEISPGGVGSVVQRQEEEEEKEDEELIQAKELSISHPQKTDYSQFVSSPADRILYLQRIIGSQPVLRLPRSGALHPKLRIGQPGDRYEQEADRVADAVMRLPQVQRQVGPEDEEEEDETLQPKPFAEEITPLVQRQVEPEEEEKEEELQAKSTSGHIFRENPNLESHILSLKGGGQPLSANDRAFFEPCFGRDFSQVRVHTDAQATEAARAVNARAFTVGNDIAFGGGYYAPETSGGKRLLAHELTHIVQQKGHGSALRKKEDKYKNNDVKMSWLEQMEKLGFEILLDKVGAPKKPVMGLINRAGSAITEIFKYPGRFVNTLIQALRQGFQQFNDNIGKHLKAGFTNWLFGTMAKTGIHLPKDFSPRSILALVLQVLGISQALIRQKVAKAIGEKNVRRIEKAWEILSTFMKNGIGGLWEMLKDYLSDLKEIVIREISNWVIVNVIKKAVLKVLGLFNPVSGLITIIKTICNVIEFLIERASQIMALFNAIAGSVEELAMGNVTKAANKVEDTLARLLPVAIGFLASLLDIGSIAGEIKGIIKRLQARVHKAIDRVVGKVVDKVSSLFKRRKDIQGKPRKPVKEREVKPDLRSAKDIVIDTIHVKLPKGARQVADVRKVLTGVATKVSPTLIDLKVEEVLPGKPKKEGAIGFKVKARAGKGDLLIDAVRYSEEGGALSYEERWKMGVKGIVKDIQRLEDRGITKGIIEKQFSQWKSQFGFTSLTLQTEERKLKIMGEMSPGKTIAKTKPSLLINIRRKFTKVHQTHDEKWWIGPYDELKKFRGELMKSDSEGYIDFLFKYPPDRQIPEAHHIVEKRYVELLHLKSIDPNSMPSVLIPASLHRRFYTAALFERLPTSRTEFDLDELQDAYGEVYQSSPELLKIAKNVLEKIQNEIDKRL